MRKLIEFFKRLWRLITGQEVRPYVESEKPVTKKNVLGAICEIGIHEQEESIE